MNTVAATIILYNPDEGVIHNLNSCQKQVGKTYIIDNSDIPHSLQFQSSANLEYLPQKNNVGIAKSLNTAAEKAIGDGFNYLLTLDQDTIVPVDLVAKLYDTIQMEKNAAIAAPFYSNINYNLEPSNRDVVSPLVVPTSANLIDLKAYMDTGPFLDDMFIDYVDFEFCMRLKLKGYKVLQNNAIIVKHNVGILKLKKILFFSFYTTNHLPLRLYYRTRNRFFLRKKYSSEFPDFFRKDRINFIKEIVKTLLAETKKFKKLRMVFLGYRHYTMGRLGELKMDPSLKHVDK